jgi:hypothetical protein
VSSPLLARWGAEAKYDDERPGADADPEDEEWEDEEEEWEEEAAPAEAYGPAAPARRLLKTAGGDRSAVAVGKLKKPKGDKVTKGTHKLASKEESPRRKPKHSKKSKGVMHDRTRPPWKQAPDEDDEAEYEEAEDECEEEPPAKKPSHRGGSKSETKASGSKSSASKGRKTSADDKKHKRRK